MTRSFQFSGFSALKKVLLTGGSGLSTYGFLIVPAGVGWMLAAGIVLLRRIGTTQANGNAA
ncbi:hypothetical protein IIA28_05610 [candidate division KSB1 bacterium]|nr:hypothetical protein [candidate division KSB1 bacterium]